MNDGNESAVLFDVLNAYLADVEAGRAPGRDELLARHPELRDRLATCLDSLDVLHLAGGKSDGEPDGTIGDYRILREVGRGGMGVVYEAEQISLQRRVALKMLPFAGVLEPRHLQRFRNEALAAAALNHHHIVPVYSVGQDRGIHHYAMQYVDGISVAHIIEALRQGGGAKLSGSSSSALDTIAEDRSARSGGFCRAVARLGAQAADALEHAHACGVIHRDVKPANLLVDGRGELWITDFGLASIRTQPGLTVTGDIIGTLRYMSPEQTRGGQRPFDHRTDVYSLGTTLYEFVTLECAFSGEDPASVIQQIAHQEPVLPSAINSAVPDELETILLKAMAKEPADRYSTARELAEDLQRFLADEPIHARRPTMLQRTAKWARRHRGAVAAAGVVLFFAAAGFAASTLLFLHERDLAREQRNLARARGAGLMNVVEQARVTFDSILDRVSESQPPGDRIGQTKAAVLARLRRFYEVLARMPGDGAIRHRAAAQGYWGLARIVHLLRDDEAATRDYEEAVRLLRIAIGFDPASHPELARVLADFGRFLAQTDFHEEAENALQESIVEWDRSGDAYASALGRLALGIFLRERERPDEAIQVLLEASPVLEAASEERKQELTCLAESAACYWELGQLFEQTGDPEAAEQAHTKSADQRLALLRTDPKNERYRGLWGASYLEVSRYNARRLGAEGPPPPFDPEIEWAGDLEEVLSSTPLPFEGEIESRMAGFERSLVTHRGHGTVTLMGEVYSDATICWLPCKDGIYNLTVLELRARQGGDRLMFHINGSPEGKPRRMGGSFLVVGGTGRFRGAGGSGTTEVVGRDLKAGTLTIRFHGTIQRGVKR
ncbi:MAG: protein kinase domain-containing protein [Planctomycetota bacterium]|jgi:serine/threonine protein kinase